MLRNRASYFCLRHVMSFGFISSFFTLFLSFRASKISCHQLLPFTQLHRLNALTLPIMHFHAVSGSCMAGAVGYPAKTAYTLKELMMNIPRS